MLAPKSRCSTTRLSAATVDDWAIRSLMGPCPVDSGLGASWRPEA
jgi:hypothetical protein